MIKRLATALVIAFISLPEDISAQTLKELMQADTQDVFPLPDKPVIALDHELEFLVRPPAYIPPGEGFDISGLSPTRVIITSNSATIPYLDIVIKEAEKQQVDPGLILAVIQQESQFYRRAKSPVGARGLMQIMPATAKLMGLKDPELLWKPEVNIKYGTRFLKDLWTQFGKGDISEIPLDGITARQDFKNVVAAYNAGPGNVRKYKGVPPFKETRAYVRKVVGYFQMFKSITERIEVSSSGPVIVPAEQNAGPGPQTAQASAATEK